MPPRKRRQAARDTAPEPSTPSSLEPGKMTVAALRQELGSRGLDSHGKKAELVARLEAELAGPSQGPSPAKKSKKQPKPEPEKEQEEPEPMEEETDFSKAKRALMSGEGADQKKKKASHAPKVDSNVPSSASYLVVGEYDCMLNQTNIGHNNNKFYVIQLLARGSSYFVWARWGRVGEGGQNSNKMFGSLEKAEKEFCKKFRDKTRNSWEERADFTPVQGKYTLLEMDDEEGGEEELVEKLTALDDVDAPVPVVKQCSLDKPTQNLMKLIFDHDMFQSAMQSMEIDTKKMPLGKLSKAQIAKGFEALEAIEDALDSGIHGKQLLELSSKFYTIIPHSFGRNIPPVIRDKEHLQRKFDMLLVLGDIELAQGLERAQEKKQKEVSGERPHPLDVNYESLKAGLSHVKEEEEEYDVIEKYLTATKPSWRKAQLLDVFRVDREGEGERFGDHSGLENRRLLWHGTNVAVVAAILKSGLRIMPHSGGRVGRGIYFASECSKSAGYVRCAGDIGIMFLSEVALGREKHITVDDSSLKKAPAGYDSIVARGRTEPDPSLDTALEFDGRKVVVPQGPPKNQAKFSGSSFSQSEYLIYRESQNRIRYLLKMKM